MESAQSSKPDLPVSSSVSQKRTAEIDSMRAVPQYALLFTPVSSTPECPLPSASPLVLRTARHRRRLDEQPLVAHQERSTEATSVAEVSSLCGQAGSRKRVVIEAQLAERRRVSETTAAAAAAAASQDSNDKPAEAEASEQDEDEGDPTDVEADFEETTAMAMRDRVVQCQRLFAVHGHGDWHRNHLYRLAPAVVRILQQISRRYLQRPNARWRTALSEWATGARSASTCFPIPTHHPCTVCIGV